MTKIKKTVSFDPFVNDRAEKMAKKLGFTDFGSFINYLTKRACCNPLDLVSQQMKDTQQKLMFLNEVRDSLAVQMSEQKELEVFP